MQVTLHPSAMRQGCELMSRSRPDERLHRVVAWQGGKCMHTQARHAFTIACVHLAKQAARMSSLMPKGGEEEG